MGKTSQNKSKIPEKTVGNINSIFTKKDNVDNNKKQTTDKIKTPPIVFHEATLNVKKANPLFKKRCVQPIISNLKMATHTCIQIAYKIIS